MLLENYTRLDKNTIKNIEDVCEYTYNKCKPYFVKTRIALDIGCKKGGFAKHICKDFNHVHMFDMRPKMQWQHLNRGNCTLHKFAIGAANGIIKHSGALTNVIVDGIEMTTSPVKTIDSLNFECVDFIKIDVEGDEEAVLQGAKETLEKWKPVVVLEQNHTTEKYGKGKYGDAIRWLEDHKYKITDYDGMDDWIMTHV